MTERTRQRQWPATYSSPYQVYKRDFYHTGFPWKDPVWKGLSYAYKTPFYELMNDGIGPRPYPDRDLFHDKFRGHPGRLSGSMSYWSSARNALSEIQDHTNTHIGDSGWQYSGSGHLQTHMSIYPSDYINAAISAGSPGEADVDLGEFIGELREWRDLVPRSTVGIPIWFAFSLRPLLADLLKLQDIAESVNQRMHELNRLTGRTEKKRVGLGRAQSRKTTPSTLEGLRFKKVKVTQVRAYCVKTHSIEHDRLKPPKLWNTAKTRRLLYSAHPLVTIWNLLPWSWFIDYFFEVDAMIKSMSNKLPGYQVNSLCIGVEEKTKVRLEKTGMVNGWADLGLTINGGSWERTTYRRLIDGSPRTRFPSFTLLLSKGQIANILALAAAMADKRSGLVRDWERRYGGRRKWDAPSHWKERP